MTSLRRAWGPALLVVMGLLVVAGVAELAVRMVAWLSPKVAYLATAGVRRPAPVFRSLEELLAAYPTHIEPHREFLNHWTNALGFHDKEFAVPKPPSRFRIMALGDSFTYGSVPYPASVMTLLEAGLRARCPTRDLDLLNFGIPATGVWEYKAAFELGHQTYAPDLVLVHLYLGNDGPDTYRHVSGLPARGSAWPHSYVWTLLRNVARLRTSVAPPPRVEAARPEAGSGARPRRGGEVVDSGRTLPPDHSFLAGPSFTPEAFVTIEARELGRLYVPPDPRALDREWRPVLDVLDTLRAEAAATDRPLVLVLYPSALQIYPDRRRDALEGLRGRRRDAGLTAERIDARLPNRMVLAHCRQRGIACLDVTDGLARASAESPEPLYKTRDTHWTVRGNRVAAEAEARLLAPLVCPATTSARSSRPQAGGFPDP